MRQFLKELDLVEVEKEVSTRYEVAEFLKGNRPTLFKKVKDYPNFRIIGNLIYSREVAAKAIGSKAEEFISKFLRALENPRKYRTVDSAPFQENKFAKPEILKHIPLLIYFKPYDYYYTSATIFLARDPETDRMNASFHRMMYLGGNRFSVRLVPRDLHSFYLKNKERGNDTEVVIICGVHPAISIAAATSYPFLNEIELANAFLNGKLECVDLNGFDVPANSEVVMHGRILHDKFSDEGPFIDLTGTWDAVRKQPIVEIDELYFRNDPIWQVILPGGIEHRLLMGLPQEPRMFKIIKNAVAGVKNVILTEGGCCWLHAVVSIKKVAEGEGKLAGLAALAAHPSLKRVIVVDEDIDITNPNEVEWALATRLDPSKGIIIIPEVKGSSLDPSSAKRGLITKWIIDATVPLDKRKEKFKKVI